MNFIAENAIFFFYVAASAIVALFAFLWGGRTKLMGAGLLLASIPVSNILHSILVLGWLTINQFAVSLITLDFMLAYLFFEIARRSTRLEPSRWAVFVTAIHISMALVNIAAAIIVSFSRTAEYHLILNLLLITAFLACIAGFTPKSRKEAFGILRMKWVYFKSDWFRLSTYLQQIRNRALSIKNISPSPAISDLDEHIGKKLREARITAGYSREVLAKKLGVTIPQIQKYETGATRLTASSIYILSEIFNLEISYFYDGYTSADAKGVKPIET